MKTVLLFGGSFNPPHVGHFDVAKYAYEKTGADEVWFLFAVNHFKKASDYANVQHRMAMGEILSAQYPDVPIVMSDFQDRINQHATYDVLRALKAEYPDTRFIWCMGADSLVQFNFWANYKRIMQEVPILVISRPGYMEDALTSVTAKEFQHLRLENAGDLKAQENGWSALKGLNSPYSSSGIIRDLAAGRRHFEPEMQAAIDYILAEELYGTGGTEMRVEADPFSSGPG